MRLIFEWDIRKERLNINKHGVTFDEAKSIFADENLLTFKDDFHSEAEDRFLSIGLSTDVKILLVVHTEIGRNSNEILIRLISARKATRNEQKRYEEG
ncbi:MAG: BrnT family toxin [Pyrinomonadaceae bacterium]